MSRRSKGALFEEIRREHEFGVGTIRGVSRTLGVHRRMVRQALSDAVPPARKAPNRKKPRLEPVMEFINSVLEADREAPREQRHTSHRIFEADLAMRGITQQVAIQEWRCKKLWLGLFG